MSTVLTKGGNFRSTESIIMLLIDELINNKTVLYNFSKTDEEIILNLRSVDDTAGKLIKLFNLMRSSIDE